MRIESKKQMYQLFDTGFFGNSSQNFDTPEDAYCWLARDPDVRSVMIRTKIPAGRCDPFIRYEDLPDRVWSFIHDGYTREMLQFSEMMPEKYIILQGYMWEGLTYHWSDWVLDYNDIPNITMREGMKNPKRLTGSSVYLNLQKLMDESSWNNFLWLLEACPGHVHEFSIYSISVGTLGWNTCFWESRLY